MLKRDEIATPTSCLNKAADDEPVFVLRAKDPLAARVVRHWCTLAEQQGLHEDKVPEADALAFQMESWRAANPKRVPGDQA